MNGDKEFYTQMGYRLQNAGGLTDTMEDYLEMIARCAQETGYVRMNQLAERLHVRPSSASKMVGKLKELGLLDFEKYGLIGMTEEGRAVGRRCCAVTTFCTAFSVCSIAPPTSWSRWSGWSILSTRPRWSTWKPSRCGWKRRTRHKKRRKSRLAFPAKI